MSNWVPSPQRGIGLLALLGASSVLVVLGGGTGVVFGLAALGAWVVAPPVFAFVFAQSGLAAVTSPPILLPVAFAEVGLLAMLVTDPESHVSVRDAAIVVVGVGTLTGLVWSLQPTPLWLAAVLVLLGISGFVYGVHRFELLATGQLTEQ